MLYKILTLSPHTITGTNGRDLEEYNRNLTPKEKLDSYLDWNDTEKTWKAGENRHRLAFKMGLIDFIHYENSPLWLIDHWHPSEFRQILHDNILWDEQFYEWIICIDVDLTQKNFLLKNQSSKSYYLDWEKEYRDLCMLKETFKDRLITVSFDCFCDRSLFLQAIAQINQKLHLDLDMEYAETLWTRWYDASIKVWKQ